MTARRRWILVTLALIAVSTIGVAAPCERAAAGEVSVDVSLFFEALAPHGEWVRVTPYGWAWAPEDVPVGWRPYTVGWWAWVEPYGWTWVSDEPWGWATYHYGRWLYVEDYGWVWLPGTTWGPAWVAFRYGGPWVGWAPLPPGPGWRIDAGIDLGGLNVSVSIGTYAWTFTTLRAFSDPDVGHHAYAAAYNPWLVERTEWSTRYAAFDGGVANLGVDVEKVEKARGSPIPRRRLRDATVPEKGGVRVDGDAVVAYRPRVAAKVVETAPPPRRRATPPSGWSKTDLDAWAEQRRSAVRAHLDAERKALEARDVAPPAPAEPKPGAGAEEAARRREAAMKALEEERRRMEALIERQRLRREREIEDSGPPAGSGGGSSGMGGGHGGMGGGMR